MAKARLSVVIAVVASLGAAAITVYADTPTEANFATCNAEVQTAMKAGTATPTTKDHLRAEAARKGSTAIPHSTESTGKIVMESSDPQLVGMAAERITDAAYQAVYRTCMRRSGF